MPKTIYDKEKKEPQGQIERGPFARRAAALEAEGKQFYAAWKDLRTYLNPTRGYFYDEKPNQGKTIDHQTLVDGHAKRAIRDSASGMMSGFTSPSRPWFKVETPDPDLNEYAPVKRQLDEISRRTMTVMSTSNIYDTHYSVYEEILTFGTACAAILGDFFDVIRGKSFTCGEYFVGYDGEGRLNAFYHRFYMNVGQLVNTFGIENVSATTKAAYEQNHPDNWVLVHHLIENNDDRIPFYKDYKNMPIRSVYWEDGAKDREFLRKGGYEEQCILAPRWHTTTSAESYGKGPGWDVLGDVKMLQKEQQDKLLGLEKIVNPPMQRDASVIGEVNTLPGGVTTFSAQLQNAGLRPAYQVAIDINAIREDIMETKKAISEAFYADLFKMMLELDRGQITAYEIAQRQAEKLSMLAPFTEKLNNEYLNPFISRVFGIMLRAQLFPAFPPEMRGMDLRIKYISLMAQAQKMIGISGIEQTVGFAGKIAAANPAVLDNINWDEAVTVYADMMGTPAKIIRSKEEMAQIRKERAKQAAQAAQAQNVAIGAEAAAKGAKAIKDLSGAPLGIDSALDRTMKTVEEMAQ